MAWYTLALDLSKNTGWAVAEDSCIIASGTFDLSASAKAHHKQGMRIMLLEDNFRRNGFHEFINEIVIEDIMVFGGKNRIQSQMGIQSYFHLQGKVYEYARSIGCNPPTIINPKSLKKSFTGYGGAQKEDIAREAESRGWTGAIWGADNTIINHDEADAIALLFVNAELKQTPMGF